MSLKKYTQGDVVHTRQAATVQAVCSLVSLPVVIYFWHWWYALYLVGFYCLLLFIGHHAALHRYFTHRSYKVNNFWHAFLAIVGCLPCFGSPAGYALVHRTHHVYSDTDKDPHSHKHIGMLRVLFFRWNTEHVSMWHIIKEMRDPWIKFTYDYYILIPVVFALTLLAIDPISMFCYNVAAVTAMFAMGYINIGSHTDSLLTYRNHQTRDDSHNSLTGLLIGEWHNNHHANPRAWNQRERWWEIDYAAQFIRMIKK